MRHPYLHSAAVGRQISVFVQNEPGILAAITRALGEAGVNIYALCLSEGLEAGYLRLVVDRTDDALRILNEAKYLTMEREIMLLELTNHPGSLEWMTGALAEAGHNLDYAYCASGPQVEIGIVVVRVKDCAQGIRDLEVAPA